MLSCKFNNISDSKISEYIKKENPMSGDTGLS